MFEGATGCRHHDSPGVSGFDWNRLNPSQRLRVPTKIAIYSVPPLFTCRLTSPRNRFFENNLLLPCLQPKVKARCRPLAPMQSCFRPPFPVGQTMHTKGGQVRDQRQLCQHPIHSLVPISIETMRPGSHLHLQGEKLHAIRG